MTANRIEAENPFRFLTMAGVAVLLVVIFAGCQTGNYANMKYSREVTDMFNAYEVPPDHLWYYSGPDSMPYAFIGVNKAYHLESRFWKPVDLSPDILRSWLNFKSGDRANQTTTIFGIRIIAPNGEDIGYWYSVRNPTDIGVVRIGEGNVVNITTPRGDSQTNTRRDSDR